MYIHIKIEHKVIEQRFLIGPRFNLRQNRMDKILFMQDAIIPTYITASTDRKIPVTTSPDKIHLRILCIIKLTLMLIPFIFDSLHKLSYKIQLVIFNKRHW